jgi:putative oxidoreductase
MHKIDRFVDDHALRLGRILIGILFLVSGVASLLDFNNFAGYAGLFLPMGKVMATLAIIFKIGGGLGLILGIRTRMSAYALIVFTLLVTVLVHGASWLKATDKVAMMTEMISVLKNMAIIGGLLLSARYSPPAVPSSDIVKE